MRVRLGVAVALAVTALVASACTEDTSSGSAAGGGSDGGRTDNKALAALQDKIDSYTAVPKWQAPGPPVDPAPLRGETVFNIPDSSGNPFATGIAQSEAAAAKALGITFINCTNQGQVTEWVSCYNQAIQRKV